MHFHTACISISFFKPTNNYCEKNGTRIANMLLYSTALIIFEWQFLYIALPSFKLLFALQKNESRRTWSRITLLSLIATVLCLIYLRLVIGRYTIPVADLAGSRSVCISLGRFWGILSVFPLGWLVGNMHG